MPTIDSNVPRNGRCQHCQQLRPLFPHITTCSSDPYTPGTPAQYWLCARDWSAAEEADQNGQSFYIDHDLIVWPDAYERCCAQARQRIVQIERDWAECRGILLATKEAEAAGNSAP
ncbi:hypothetical protein [Streptomyces olivaceiscleroticus]|uniref:Ferredoxin n=1 Tax=Streptomyces olivaceiscleroticus TaxID=68245 RepID=A0ABP3LGY8_9ACTN